MSSPPKRYVFLELTNFCNFSCTFCPDGIMKRPRKSMDRELALRIIDEVAGKQLTQEPIQLHLMGEPFLYHDLFDIIQRIHDRGLRVRLFTNGSLLTEKNRESLFFAVIEELVIGIHTFNENLYNAHRRGRPDFETYMDRIKAAVEDKFRMASPTRIVLQYLNTKHFNRVRLEKGYSQSVLPLVDTDEKAFSLIDEWKDFGRELAARYGIDFEPEDLECLKGPYKDAPLDCLKGDHCEILPDIILSFKDISPFSDYLMQGLRYVERYKAECHSFDEQIAVLSNGACTPCCVDYDGRIDLGSALSKPLGSILKSKTLHGYREDARKGRLPTPTCRVCKAILVEDDYEKKFPGSEKGAYQLEYGWYPLENDGREFFRWTGKRAAVSLKQPVKALVFKVRNAHPNLESLEVCISQGKHKKGFRLKDRSWNSIGFFPKSTDKFGSCLVIESKIFWIPAEILEDTRDRRELGVMVSDILIT